MISVEEFSIFDGLSRLQKERLRYQVGMAVFKRGQVVYKPGDVGKDVYLLAEGRIRVAKVSGSHKELTLAYHEPGELFGEMALVSEAPRRTRAEAVAASKLYNVGREVLLELARSSPEFALRLGEVIGKRRHEIENRMESLVFHDVPSRLAGQLLALSRRYGIRKESGLEIGLKLSQQELAKLIGATRETTSTALNQLKREGVLDTDHRTIIIFDLQALKDLAEEEA